jgi:hypothetical protein
MGKMRGQRMRQTAAIFDKLEVLSLTAGNHRESSIAGK